MKRVVQVDTTQGKLELFVVHRPASKKWLTGDAYILRWRLNGKSITRKDLAKLLYESLEENDG